MHASLELRPVLASQCDRLRSYFVVHALEIIQWAQKYEDNAKRAPRAVKAAVAAATTIGQRMETSICNLCITGRTACFCPSYSKGKVNNETPQRTLEGLVAQNFIDEDEIVDYGACTHLVKDRNMLYDWVECDEPDGVTLPDKSALRVTRRGIAKMRVKVDDETF